jgi:hypothetical protein
MRIKQEIASDLVAKFPWVEQRLSLQKIKFMPVSEVFKIQSRLELNHAFKSGALRLQRWWREKLRKWRITFRPALERWKSATKIQRWLRRINRTRIFASIHKARVEAAIKI